MADITTSTSTESVTNIVSTNSLVYIRAQVLTLTASSCRPNTPVNVFFDATIVNHFCTPVGGALGDQLITSANGTISFTLTLPGGTFNTGVREIVVTDSPSLAAINGLVYGTAKTFFTSSGTQQIYQTTNTTTTTNFLTVDKLVPAVPDPTDSELYDPIAQSFFTYGKTGGVFVTSIELFFYSKDANIPVRVEIRDMVNGYPSSKATTNPDLIVYKNPVDVNVSTDASLATKFTFAHPVYLTQDKDYCFVVHSNSNNYYMFTSNLGEKSFETGKTIFDQPYIGVMYKSSNNSTWTAEQTEDIKFNINVARFDISTSGLLTVNSQATYFAVPSIYFSTTAGSNVVTYKQPQKHGLEVSSKIDIVADSGATYNGIPADYMSGNRTVTNVVDEYTVQYLATDPSNVAANALSAGPIITGGQVKLLKITNGGSGYTSAPLISFTSLSGVNAAATAIISGGAVVAIKVTNPGSGYTTPPTVTFNDGGGLGAAADVLIDGMFAVRSNKPVNFITPNIPASTIGDTSITGTLATTQLNYPGGALSTYIPSGTILPLNVNGKTSLPTNGMVASPENEVAKMSGNPSMQLQYTLLSTNPNISPVIDMRNNPSISAYSYRINNQIGEVMTDVSNTELAAASGTAETRYLSKKTGIKTPSTGVLLTSAIYSQQDSSVEWYIRTALSGSGVDIATMAWKLLTCDISVNKSTKAGQFLDYSFYLYGIPTFDTYELKAVLRTSNPAVVPIVNNYRVIVTA